MSTGIRGHLAGGHLHEFLQRDIDYVIRVDEILWGCALLAITLVVHGAGVFQIARASARLIMPRRRVLPGFRTSVLILAILGIVILHLLEVALWSGFFTWKAAQPNESSAFYHALVNYTTLGAGYLPVRWRLLEGMLGMAGLLCFAFSTSALLALAQQLVHLPFMGPPASDPDERARGASSGPAARLSVRRSA